MVDLIHKAAEVVIARPAADERAENGIEVLQEEYDVTPDFFHARYVDAMGHACSIRKRLQVPTHDSNLQQLNDAEFQAFKEDARKQALALFNKRTQREDFWLDLFK